MLKWKSKRFFGDCLLGQIKCGMPVLMWVGGPFSALLDMALLSQEAELAATPASVTLRCIFIALVLWKDFQALLESR